MRSIHLEEMSWLEVKEALEQGFHTVIVPVASTEQHGPHLPLGTDSYGGDCYGTKVAEKLGHTLIAPTIRFGCSMHHMGFPGTITLSTETLLKVLRDVCLSLDHHGFKYIVLMSNHGNNHGPVIAAAQEMAPQVKATIIALAYPNQPSSKMREVNNKYKITLEEAGYHAGASETAFIMAYKPKLVHNEKIVKGYVGPYSEKYFYTVQEMKRIAPIGVFGDPTKATKEMGEEHINAVVDQYVDIIKHEINS